MASPASPMAPRPWALMPSLTASGPRQMALDRWMLEQVTRGHGPGAMLRFYRWDKPSISLGHHQSSLGGTTDLPVVRRPTGGRQCSMGVTSVMPLPWPNPRRAPGHLRLNQPVVTTGFRTTRQPPQARDHGPGSPIKQLLCQRHRRRSVGHQGRKENWQCPALAPRLAAATRFHSAQPRPWALEDAL